MEQYSLPGYHLGKVWYYSAGLGVSSTSEERSKPSAVYRLVEEHLMNMESPHATAAWPLGRRRQDKLGTSRGSKPDQTPQAQHHATLGLPLCPTCTHSRLTIMSNALLCCCSSPGSPAVYTRFVCGLSEAFCTGYLSISGCVAQGPTLVRSTDSK
jgi:hypothetical protein